MNLCDDSTMVILLGREDVLDEDTTQAREVSNLEDTLGLLAPP